MNSGRDDLSWFRDAYLDYLERHRDEPPALEGLPEDQRPAAEAFIKSITAARGIDPYASRPSIEQLLVRRSQANDLSAEFDRVIRDHLRATVDPRASVTPDAASAAVGLASVSVIRARGMRIRVVPETSSTELAHAITSRAEDIADVFSAFPDSPAVLYTTAGIVRLGVIVDRGDVHGAIETPSGERRAPRLRRSIADASTACEEWLTGMIPNFAPLRISLSESTAAPESAMYAYHLASRVIDELSADGARARIEAKRTTWRDFGLQETQRLASIVQEAQLGHMSEEAYKFHLDRLVGVAS